MNQRDYLPVKQAAALLQVAPNTVRSWGAAGKIPEYRHPINGYRLYRKTDLEQVIAKLERSVVRPAKKRPRPR
jgi:DNA-binding transcriptional MerR regulator